MVQNPSSSNQLWKRLRRDTRGSTTLSRRLIASQCANVALVQHIEYSIPIHYTGRWPFRHHVLVTVATRVLLVTV